MTSRGPSIRSWSALIVLIVCLALTALATEYVRQEMIKEDRLRFDRTAHAMQRDIEERMETYVTSLRGVAGLFAASDVNAESFRRYVDRIDVTRRYPGVQGIGWAPRISASQVPALEQRAKSDGLEGFHVWESGRGLENLKFPVLYLEPPDVRNQRAMGYDMYSDPARRAAMDFAWQSGTPAATGRLELVQEIVGPKQAGFLIYVPVYKGDVVPPTQSERIANLIGFAYSPFRAGDLLDAILQEQKPEGVSIDVYDGGVVDPSKLLFRLDSPGENDWPRFQSTQTINIVSKIWTLHFRNNRQFPFGSVHGGVTGVAVVGTILSFLLFALIRSHTSARLAAERIAAELREATAELERANASKDKFLAVLSHELRTPLTPVLLSVSAMEHDEQLPKHLRESMQTVRRNVELEARLIDDLLDLTRIARGKVQFRLARVDVHEVLSAAVRVASEDGTADAKGVKIEMDQRAHRHVVRGDAARLQQIFWNVVKNSVKFTPSGGNIFVSTSDRDGKIVVKVRDTGIGMDPAVLCKIFNAFEQGEGSVTRVFGGLGLGLAISKSLVEAHHGTIVAHSEGHGKGAEFVIELPTIEEEARVQTNDAPAAPKANIGAKVLLVEDHADTAKLLARLLRRDGYDVTTASSVRDAVRIGRGEHFDLVVSDLGLPDGSGLEILPQIRADGTPSKNIRGVALTGYGMDEDVRRTQEAGYGEHLTKPVDVKQLEQAMERQLRNSNDQ